jgi:hypothetical protein
VSPRRDGCQDRDGHADQGQQQDDQPAQVGRHAHGRQLPLQGQAGHQAEQPEEEEPPRAHFPAREEIGDEQAEDAADGEDRGGQEADEPAVGGRAEPEQADAGDLAHQARERRLDVRRCGRGEVEIVGDDPVRDGSAGDRRHRGDVAGEARVTQSEDRARAPHRGPVATTGHGHPDAHDVTVLRVFGRIVDSQRHRGARRSLLGRQTGAGAPASSAARPSGSQR